MSQKPWAGRIVTTAREYWAGRIRAAGALPCWRCGQALTIASKWTVGHLIDRAAGGSVTDRANQWPECARCNYSAGGKLGAARRRPTRPAPAMLPERHRGIRGI